MLAISSRAALAAASASSSSRVLLGSPGLFRSTVAAAPRRIDALSLFNNKKRTIAVAAAAAASDRIQQHQSKAASMTSSTPTIGTHNGSFHCDEALGVALLRRTAAYADAKVVRSRNQEVLDKCDVVIDVGGVYDPATSRFDHHQKEFNDVFGHGKARKRKSRAQQATAEAVTRCAFFLSLVLPFCRCRFQRLVLSSFSTSTFSTSTSTSTPPKKLTLGFNTRLSSAGLVYKHYGREVVAKLMAKFAAEKAAKEAGGEATNGDSSIAIASPPDDADVETVYLAVYKNFMEAVDAIDNGVDQYENAGEPRYISQTNLSARVGGLNPFVSFLVLFSVFFSGFFEKKKSENLHEKTTTTTQKKTLKTTVERGPVGRRRRRRLRARRRADRGRLRGRGPLRLSRVAPGPRDRHRGARRRIGRRCERRDRRARHALPLEGAPAAAREREEHRRQGQVCHLRGRARQELARPGRSRGDWRLRKPRRPAMQGAARRGA